MCSFTPPVFWFRLWPHPSLLAWAAVIGIPLLACGAAALRVKLFARRYRALATTAMYRSMRVLLALTTGLVIMVVAITGIIVLPYLNLSKTWTDANYTRMTNAHCSPDDVAAMLRYQMHMNNTAFTWIVAQLGLLFVIIVLGVTTGVGRGRLTDQLRAMGLVRQ